MELTAEQFEQITGLTSQPPIYDGVERRKHPRVAFGSRARIYPLVPAVCPDGRSVLVRDISLGGIGLLFSDALTIGDEFIIQLPTQRGEPLVIHCIAQRCDSGGSFGKQFVIGATFEQVLDSSVLTDNSMLDSPLVQNAIANLSSTWRSPGTDEPAASVGPITRAVTSVWKRLTGAAQPEEQPAEKIADRLTALEPTVIEPLPVSAPTISPNSRLFATATTPAPVIETPAVAPAPVVEPTSALVAAIEPAAEQVEKAVQPPPAAVAPAPVTLLAPVVEPVQDVMWMPEISATRTSGRPARAIIHRMGSRHPRRCFRR